MIRRCEICNKVIKDRKRKVVCSEECSLKRLSGKAQRRYREKGRMRRLKLRFEVFQRDNFRCIYCGRKPPECILEIDHKYPKSKGGKDKSSNYVTACKECNIGKGDIILNEFKKYEII